MSNLLFIFELSFTALSAKFIQARIFKEVFCSCTTAVVLYSSTVDEKLRTDETYEDIGLLYHSGRQQHTAESIRMI